CTERMIPLRTLPMSVAEPPCYEGRCLLEPPARSSFAPRITILSTLFGNGLSSAFASSHGAAIQTSRSNLFCGERQRLCKLTTVRADHRSRVVGKHAQQAEYFCARA